MDSATAPTLPAASDTLRAALARLHAARELRARIGQGPVATFAARRDAARTEHEAAHYAVIDARAELDAVTPRVARVAVASSCGSCGGRICGNGRWGHE